MNNNASKTTWLIKLFEKTTNSYKIFFFIALLNKIKETPLKKDFSLDEIVKELLLISWYPGVFFKLSFGKQDQIYNILTKITEINSFTPNHDSFKLIKSLIDENYHQINGAILKKYVPIRLIRPFFEEETRSLKDSLVNSKIIELSNLEFEIKDVLYKIDQPSDSIIISPSWLIFITENLSLIEQWAHGLLANYLQKHNLNTPNLINKISPVLKRTSLRTYRKEWDAIAAKNRIFCPYSQNRISTKTYHLDHYLPWSFVVHDKPWNLIPCTEDANLQKGNKLPSIDYFEIFVHNQKIRFQFLLEEKMHKEIEEYAVNLAISPDLSNDAFITAYKNAYQPLLSIAKNQGFTAEWRYLNV